MRWSEELELLTEERRRVLQTFEHTASIWNKRATDRIETDSSALAEGRSAFARKQADLFGRIESRCAQTWFDVSTYLERFGDKFDDDNSAEAVFSAD
jgi:hypothetical protein